MAFNNVPVNGWPQIKDLEKLDAIAQQIENMPTFTSNDKAFLEALPAYPSEDGKKALVATTSSGNTSLNYEEISDLPADPETDGVRVLTATTSSGDTVKSWETPQTGENIVYSTTPVECGTWVDNRKVKRVCIPFNTVDNATATISLASYNIDIAWCIGCFVKETKYGTNNIAFTPLYDSSNDSFHFQYVASTNSLSVVCGGEKQGSGYVILEYVEKTV